MQKMVFIPNRNWPTPEKRGSSLMRACVISSYMKKNFNDRIDVRYERGLPNDFSKDDIAIFVKDSDHRHISLAKERGCITVYDPIDVLHTFQNRDKFDLMISSSRIHSEILSKNHEIDIKRIVCIDHLHTNIYRKKPNPYDPKDTLNVGYVGVTNNLCLNEFDYKKFVNCLSENKKIQLKEKSTLNLKLSLSDSGDVKNLYETFEDIHVGLSLYDEKLEPRRRNEKPSTKLTAFCSYSIPCVATYQESYRDIITEFPKLNDYMAENVEHAVSIVNKLTNDYDYYVESRVLFDSIGEIFHMKNSYKLYVDQINSTYKSLIM